MINPPTITRRRISVTLGLSTATTAVGAPRTVSCLSPSYSAAIAGVLARLPGHAALRVVAIGEADARGRIHIRRQWPHGVDPSTARMAATDLDVDCDDALARP